MKSRLFCLALATLPWGIPAQTPPAATASPTQRARALMAMAAQEVEQAKSNPKQRRYHLLSSGYRRLQAASQLRLVEDHHAILEVLRGGHRLAIEQRDKMLAFKTTVFVAAAWSGLDETGQAHVAIRRARALLPLSVKSGVMIVLGTVEVAVALQRGEFAAAEKTLAGFQDLARQAGHGELVDLYRVEILERSGKIEAARKILAGIGGPDWDFRRELFRSLFTARHGRADVAEKQFATLLGRALTNDQRMRVLVARGELRHSLRRPVAAIADLRQAEDLARRAGIKGHRHVVLLRLVMVNFEIGEFGEVAALVRRITDDDPVEVVRADLALLEARVAFDLADSVDDRNAAITLGEHALRIAERAGLHGTATFVSRFLGECALQAGDLTKCRRHLTRAAASASALGHRQEAAMVAIRLAELDWRQGKPEAARRRVTTAMAALAADRFRRDRLPGLRLLARLDLAAGKLDAVGAHLVAAERLLNARVVRSLSLRSASMIRARHAKWSELTQDWVAARLAAHPEQAAAIVRSGWARTTAWKARTVVEGLAQRRGVPLDAMRVVKDCASLEGQAPAGGILVDFAVGEEFVYAYVATAERVRFHVLGRREDIEPALRLYREYLVDRRASVSLLEFATRGRDLYRKLLAPVLPEGCGRIVVVPHETLAGVPLEALVTKIRRKVPRTFADLAFVLDQHDVSYSPSLALRIISSGVKPRTDGGTLLVAAPDYFGRDLPPLPGALVEAEGVREFADGVQERIGATAARSKLPTDLRAFRILHFAAHGIVHPTDPRRSRIALANHDDLTLGDVQELDLNADLTVLSACDTARGRRRPGEGIQSLASAFLRAGSRAVIASHWAVVDATTARTMRDLYAGMAKGKSPRRALLEARRSLRHTNASGEGTRGKQPRRSGGPKRLPNAGHPFYWAPFVFTGRCQD